MSLKRKMKIIGLFITFIIGTIIFFLLFYKEENHYDELFLSHDDLIKKVDYSATFLVHQRDIFVEIENKNPVTIHANVIVNFLNDSDQVVATKVSYIDHIGANSKSYNTLAVDKNIVFSNYKVNVELEQIYHEKSLFDDIEIVSKKETNDSVIITYRNNSKKVLSGIAMGIVFYDAANKIVGYYEQQQLNIKSKDSATMKLIIPLDSNGNTISYARNEIVIKYAYSSE